MTIVWITSWIFISNKYYCCREFLVWLLKKACMIIVRVKSDFLLFLLSVYGEKALFFIWFLKFCGFSNPIKLPYVCLKLKISLLYWGLVVSKHSTLCLLSDWLQCWMIWGSNPIIRILDASVGALIKIVFSTFWYFLGSAGLGEFKPFYIPTKPSFLTTFLSVQTFLRIFFNWMNISWKVYLLKRPP